MTAHELQDFEEWNGVVVAIGKYGFDQLALFRKSRFECVDQWQRDFAFAQIIAHGLAEHLFAGGEIEHIVHKLEGHAEVPGEVAEAGFDGLVGSTADGAEACAGIGV